MNWRRPRWPGGRAALEEQRNGEWRYLEFLQITRWIAAGVFMREIPGGTRGRQGSAQLTCPNTDADHSDQSVPGLFAPPFLEGRDRADDAIAGDVGSSLEADGTAARVNGPNMPSPASR